MYIEEASEYFMSSLFLLAFLIFSHLHSLALSRYGFVVLKQILTAGHEQKFWYVYTFNVFVC